MYSSEIGKQIAQLNQVQSEALIQLFRESRRLKAIILRYQAKYGNELFDGDITVDDLLEFEVDGKSNGIGQKISNPVLKFYNMNEMDVKSSRIRALEAAGLITPKTTDQ